MKWVRDSDDVARLKRLRKKEMLERAFRLLITTYPRTTHSMKSEWLEGNMENGAVINNRKCQCREKFQWKNRHQRTKRMMEKKSNPKKPWKSGLQVVWVFMKKTHKRIRRPNASSQTLSQSKWRLTQDEQQRMPLQAGMNTKRQEQKNNTKNYQWL